MKLFFKEFMKWKHLKWFLLFVVCFCVGCFGMSMLQLESGRSAMPTYYDGDITLGIKTKNVTYGDYISIDGFEKHAQLHKRVIAMPGDHLTIHDSVIIINGKKLKEDYLAPINRHFAGEVDIVLGEDEYFVMGDKIIEISHTIPESLDLFTRSKFGEKLSLVLAFGISLFMLLFFQF